MSGLKRNEAARHFADGLAHQQAGRLSEARKCYERGLKLAPAQPDALFLLGQTLFESGDQSAGERKMRAAIDARPQAANYRAGLAISLFNTGRLADARPEFAHALRQIPGDPSLWRGLALCCAESGTVGDALAAAEQWCALAPADSEAAAFRAKAAAQCLFDQGAALAAAGRSDEAAAAYEQALQLAPGQAPILTNLANLYAAQRREDAALALYRQAIEGDPNYAPAYFNLGMLHLDAGRRLDAAAALQQAARCDPDNGLIAAHLLFQNMHLCRWDGLAELCGRVQQAIERNSADIPPFIVLSMPGSTAAIQRRCAENHSAWLTRQPLVETPVVARGGHSRLRVGYLSSDFKNHATAYLMVEMLEAHDRNRFETFGLSHGIDDGSAMRARVEAGFEHFVELAGLSDAASVACIAGLELDVLIDLKGYTEGNRSDWLQYRLAPVQLSWLGYPGTLGAPWIDGLVADAVVAPLAHQAMFSERLLHLPGSYQPNSRQRQCGARPTRAAEGLPEEALVLCSFNQTYKITRPIFALWLDILREVPVAVLWLWASNPWAEGALRQEALAAGIAPERLIFAEGRAQTEHLARLPLADLALDTFPCNGHTTTSDALWAGVPVVTLQGEAFAARVAGSLLAAAALPELVVESPAAYRQTVLRFCQDAAWRTRLAAQTQALREHSPLFDGAAFARKLETLLIDCASGHPSAAALNRTGSCHG